MTWKIKMWFLGLIKGWLPLTSYTRGPEWINTPTSKRVDYVFRLGDDCRKIVFKPPLKGE